MSPVRDPHRDDALGRALRALPKIDRVLAEPRVLAVAKRLGREPTARLARLVVDEARRALLEPEPAPAVSEPAPLDLERAALEVERRADELMRRRLSPVINATGVVLHTNLGRAPLSAAAARAVADSARGYVALEVELGSGRRGPRAPFAERALAELTGAEAALLVNNCAAAVLLVLGALAMGKRVLVSRGELVEIGGGFRVPEVLARSGAVLAEVGTTNKTRLSDYEAELGRGEVGAILRVHQGNFRQAGFVERPALAALAALGRERGVPVIEDLGGGALVELEGYGLAGEPTPRASLEAGVSVVCFSTDKALGGPQGGALVGAQTIVERARRDPLARALRMGRLPLVALEETLRPYLEGRAFEEVPVLAAVAAPLEAIRARAEAWRAEVVARLAQRPTTADGDEVQVEVAALEVEMGGGTLADVPLASAGLSLASRDVEGLAARLRAGTPAVLGRLREGRLLLDARTVLPHEDEALLSALVAALAP